jgi:deoxyribodipyrimidine photo-lyase
MPERPLLIWFRDDLRLADNPALSAAAESGAPIIALFVLDDESIELRPLGGASRWWLAQSLRALAAQLQRAGVPLILRRGRSHTVVTDVAREVEAARVHFNRRYGYPSELDRRIESSLRKDGVEVETFAASLMFEPNIVRSKTGTPLRVFTPFWKAALARGEPRQPLKVPNKIRGADPIRSDKLEDWSLEPTKPDWSGGLRTAWTPGEDGAKERLYNFIDQSLSGYAEARDRPDLHLTSRISPHLRFGEISPFQVWHAVRAAQDQGAINNHDADRFLTELGWREFSYHLLHQFPELAGKNFQPRFDAFTWAGNETLLARWQRGRTGYPMVDAGMRELWHTGFMHNRVRMIAASFLVKHLLIDWRTGERWFWDTLVDADPANNPASWQWVAGSGADAAPYFRIFNPTLQGEKFDPEGDYVRRWVPELAKLEGKAVHRPTQVEAPDYPGPIVDHVRARARALAAFERTRSAS